MTIRELQHAGDLASLGLTVAAILIGAVVVWAFHKPAWKALSKTPKSGTDWLIIGIYVSFVGGCLDSLYWGWAWTAVYLDWEIEPTLMRTGSIPNILSRNLCDIVAAYCHLRGVATQMNSDQRVNRPTAISMIAGAAASAAIWFTKNWH